MADPTPSFLNVPVPDPSLITVEHIQKAKSEIRQELEDKINGLARVIESRFDGMDKAAVLLDANVNRVPTVLDRELSRIVALFDERFKGIATQFTERESRFVGFLENVKAAAKLQHDSDTSAIFAALQAQKEATSSQNISYLSLLDNIKAAAKVQHDSDTLAIYSALQAQKESTASQNISNATAITKSEVGFTKEIDGLKFLLTALKEGFDGKLTDLTNRINRGEASEVGSRQAHVETRSQTGSVVGVIGGVVGMAALLVSIIFGVVQNTRATVPPLQTPPYVIK